MQPLHYDAGLCQSSSALPIAGVRINAKDHPPPHFHVLMNDGREAWVRIDTQEIIHGKIASREIAEVLAWAKANREKLADTFEELKL